MKPLTASEIKAEIARLSPLSQPMARLLLASVYDGGMTAGYAQLPRNSNPFLPPEPPEPLEVEAKRRGRR